MTTFDIKFHPLRGSAYARRHRDREIEVESDDRDRIREKDELEELRLQVNRVP